jgi:hypothetical protein
MNIYAGISSDALNPMHIGGDKNEITVGKRIYIYTYIHIRMYI